MKNFILTLLALVLSMVAVFGQSQSATSMILRYQQVTEFVFDDNAQDYVPTDTVEYSGAISIDPKKVFIKGYNQSPDKTLKIVDIQKEDGTNRDMYICQMKGERYAVALSPDKKYLTQIGINDKFIYELTGSKEVKEQVEIVPLIIKSDAEKVYTMQSLSTKPIFGNANTFDEGEVLLKEYISTEIEKYDKLKADTCYISIVISKVGTVEDAKVLFGKNEEFNAVAINIAQSLPQWKPGQRNGIPVNVAYNIEVKK